jgi:hypothetical protein
MIEELVARAFATRNAAHLAHFKTKSYAQHIALGSFYDTIIDKVDTVVEMYQGAFGLMGKVDVKAAPYDDIMNHIFDEAEWIQANRDDIADGVDAIANALDDLAGAYLTTFYKLKNLS